MTARLLLQCQRPLRRAVLLSLSLLAPVLGGDCSASPREAEHSLIIYMQGHEAGIQRSIRFPTAADGASESARVAFDVLGLSWHRTKDVVAEAYRKALACADPRGDFCGVFAGPLPSEGDNSGVVELLKTPLGDVWRYNEVWGATAVQADERDDVRLLCTALLAEFLSVTAAERKEPKGERIAEWLRSEQWRRDSIELRRVWKLLERERSEGAAGVARPNVDASVRMLRALEGLNYDRRECALLSGTFPWNTDPFLHYVLARLLALRAGAAVVGGPPSELAWWVDGDQFASGWSSFCGRHPRAVAIVAQWMNSTRSESPSLKAEAARDVLTMLAARRSSSLLRELVLSGLAESKLVVIRLDVPAVPYACNGKEDGNGKFIWGFDPLQRRPGGYPCYCEWVIPNVARQMEVFGFVAYDGARLARFGLAYSRLNATERAELDGLFVRASARPPQTDAWTIISNHRTLSEPLNLIKHILGPDGG